MPARNWVKVNGQVAETCTCINLRKNQGQDIENPARRKCFFFSKYRIILCKKASVYSIFPVLLFPAPEQNTETYCI